MTSNKCSATKIFLAIFTSLLLISHQNLASASGDEENPFMDMASAFLQNAMQGEGGGGFGQGGDGLAALGGIVGSFMQSDGGKKIGDLLSGQGGAAGGADMLSNLGTLGSLLSNDNGQIDPAMIGNVLSMFAQQGGASNRAPKQEDRRKKRQSDSGGQLDLGSILNMASSLLDAQTASNLFPMLLNTIGSFTGPQAQRRADSHASHAWFLPSYLEQAHVYWDHFIHSDLGKSVWERSGVQEIAKYFQDDKGNFDFEAALRSFENHSFRRHWIKTATDLFAAWTVHFAQPEVHQRYMSSIQYIVNSFLKSQGFPKNTMLATGNSAESMSNMANHVSRRYFSMDADVGIYVKPAIEYMQDLVAMAQSKGKSLLGRVAGEQETLSDRITDTLNLEVIEPVLRVYRAYRHSKRAPHCQEHIMCMVNRHHDTQPLGLPGFKAGLTKLSSLIASTVLSYQSGQGFWDLYNAIQNDVNCQAEYPADCGDFHDEEQKVTTEYYHNEL